MSVRELSVYGRLDAPVVGARGSLVELDGGREVLDLYGGHCVNTLGAGDEVLFAAIAEQWRQLSFATNLVHTPAREDFLEAFGANLPPGDWSVFLSNSGAEANENALKAAFGQTGRSTVVCFEGAFHGRTAAALAISDASSPYPNAPFEVRRLPLGDRAALDAVDHDVAAVVVEPIQSLAGVVTPGAEVLASLREACDRAGARLVFDEVQTGNGRLGRPWASQVYDVVPDAFTTAKGAAGGLPIGITVLSDGAFGRAPKGFGSTFGGGPTVLAAAAHVARQVASPALQDQLQRTSAALQACLRNSPLFASDGIRGHGLLLGGELVPSPGSGAEPNGLSGGLSGALSGAAVRDALLDEGVLVGTTTDARVLRLTPPLTLTLDDVERFASALDALASSLIAIPS